MCLSRLMAEEELALKESWDGKTTWKVVRKWGNPASYYTIGGLFPHTPARDVTLGEWVEEKDRGAKLWTESSSSVGAGASYPMGFHSFIRREGAEAYLLAYLLDYSWRRSVAQAALGSRQELVVVKCEAEEVVALGVQQIGVDYLQEAPTVVSRRIRILEEVPTPAGTSPEGTTGSVAC